MQNFMELPMVFWKGAVLGGGKDQKVAPWRLGGGGWDEEEILAD